MNYQETIEYLYAQLPMFSRIGQAAYKVDLHNTLALCNALDNPQHKFKSIHIAGTNGKGSTSHMLAAIFQQAGYKTGLYTSPHLKDFRERIRINGEMISQQFIIDFVERNRQLSESIQPSFFELTVAMAFDYFSKEKVDIAIIETGLGGRLDSTNVITPVLSVITNIGYDHMNLLGNTLEKIAAEKAGIIKKNIPVVIGEYRFETRPVFVEKALACDAPIYFADDLFTVNILNQDFQYLTCSYTGNRESVSGTLQLDLNGQYQAKNLATVLSSIELIREQGFMIDEETVSAALRQVKQLTGLHGRWETIAQHPTIIADVAHNEDGMRQVMSQLNSIGQAVNHHIVIGMVKDKEVEKVLSMLPVNAHYYFTQSHIPRALEAVELQSKAHQIGLKGEAYDHVDKAIAAARSNAAPSDLIVICGSVFLIGEISMLKVN